MRASQHRTPAGHGQLQADSAAAAGEVRALVSKGNVIIAALQTTYAQVGLRSTKYNQG